VLILTVDQRRKYVQRCCPRLALTKIDIGDSGLAQAYSAWKAVTKSSSKELRLPGLDYTPEQLFFLSFARIWAQLVRPATAVSRIRTDPHSPPYWRATGTLRNFDVFHKAFNCKAGSRVSLFSSIWSEIQPG
jgi:endothelin-converting enzyme